MSGRSDLAERCAEGDPIRLPYPGSLQRALDRLVARCLVENQDPPQSMVDLIRWCTRPVDQWPVRLDVDGLDPANQCKTKTRLAPIRYAAPSSSRS
ncbi:hypothetical protein [Catenulispora sp. GAS73]|uniref:pPIWI_RE_Y domain-containing protein n=1 Tax=Catenulispora sp. GAS73 TaxID=3156269 RepID=UPI003517931C